jgi:hypothetical protein
MDIQKQKKLQLSFNFTFLHFYIFVYKKIKLNYFFINILSNINTHYIIIKNDEYFINYFGLQHFLLIE